GAVMYGFLAGAAATSCSTTPGNATFEGATSFSIAADFSTAEFSSDSTGVGSVFIQVSGQDAVGNPATFQLPPVAVTRVRWMRKVVPVISLAGAPIVSGNLELVV